MRLNDSAKDSLELAADDLPADQILMAAIGDLQCAIVIGVTTDGAEYFASSLISTPETLYLVERFKKFLMSLDDEDDDEEDD